MAQLVSNNQTSHFAPEVAARAPQPKPRTPPGKSGGKYTFADQLSPAAPTRSDQPPQRLAPRENQKSNRNTDFVDRQLRNERSTAANSDNSSKRSTTSEKSTHKTNESGLDKALKSSRAVANRTPVLSFLSGHVENINPDHIPALVGNNKFINQALGEADMQAFFDQPQTLAALASSLELPDEVLAVAQTQGITPTMAVTPRELLEALGQDSNRAIIELSLLKERLPNEGVSHYMIRSASLRQAQGIKETTNQIHSQQATTAFDQQDDLEKKLESGLPVNTIIPGQPTIPAVDPEVPFAGEADKQLGEFSGQSSPPGAGFAPSNAGSTNMGMNGEGSSQAAAMHSTSHQNAFHQAAGEQLAKQQHQPMTPQDLQQLSSLREAAQQPGEVAKATHNSFDALGQRIAQDSQAVSINFTNQPLTGSGSSASTWSAGLGDSGILSQQDNAIAQQLIKPHLLMSQAARTSQQLQGVNANAGLSPAQLVAAQPESHEGDAEGSGISHLTKNSAQAAGFLSNVNLLNKSSSLSAQNTLTALQTSGTGAGIGVDAFEEGHSATGDRDGNEHGNDRGNEQGDRQGFRDILQHGRESLAMNSLKSDPALANSDRLTATSFESQLSVQERTEIMREIAAKATAFIRNSGSANGHFTFGIRNDSLGQVDISLSLSGDQLDIKMLTSSDQSRDRVVAELAGLREALSTQSVHLGKVDVGVEQRPDGQSSFAEQQAFQFDQGSQNQDQSLNQERDAAMLAQKGRPSVGDLARRSADNRAGIQSMQAGQLGQPEVNLSTLRNSDITGDNTYSSYSARGRLG